MKSDIFCRSSLPLKKYSCCWDTLYLSSLYRNKWSRGQELPSNWSQSSVFYVVYRPTFLSFVCSSCYMTLATILLRHSIQHVLFVSTIQNGTNEAKHYSALMQNSYFTDAYHILGFWFVEYCTYTSIKLYVCIFETQNLSLFSKGTKRCVIIWWSASFHKATFENMFIVESKQWEVCRQNARTASLEIRAAQLPMLFKNGNGCCLYFYYGVLKIQISYLFINIGAAVTKRWVWWYWFSTIAIYWLHFQPSSLSFFWHCAVKVWCLSHFSSRRWSSKQDFEKKICFPLDPS